MKQKPFSIFAVEDNEWYNRLLVHTLSLNPDYHVESFFIGKDLLEKLHERPDVITLDYRLPDTTGTELLRKIKDFDERIEVVIISEQDDIETAVDLLKHGAFDYIVKSNDIKERLLNTMQIIRRKAGMQDRIDVLEQEVQKKYDFNSMIIGNSVAMKRVMGMMEKAVNSNISLSISGETGTGKEVVAKAIHFNSSRKNKPFVPVNMSAIPSELFESELFGHEKGAFTGAVARRTGKFEEASGGTLFLDEIGETDLNFQPKLLRALQEKEITRIGGNERVKVDCRIIVATNRNLMEEVREEKFRKDLFYRLQGMPIELPPLRDREKDVLILARYFTENFAKENEEPLKSLSEGARKKLLAYDWPGNVRELKSVVELAIVMSQGDTLEEDDISFSSFDMMHELLPEEMTLREYDIRIVKYYMKKYDHKTKVVADKLGIGQTTVYRLLEEGKGD
ncbi:MAG: sigma-54 dependent transcriptional regulator [Bacteroidota bacterium]|nr:sigma-54 dependent transcriptional regulator [Bacteroidota bacterium]